MQGAHVARDLVHTAPHAHHRGDHFFLQIAEALLQAVLNDRDGPVGVVAGAEGLLHQRPDFSQLAILGLLELLHRVLQLGEIPLQLLDFLTGGAGRGWGAEPDQAGQSRNHKVTVHIPS